MSECQKYEDQFVEALYGELIATDKEKFSAHLKECGRCKELYAVMQKTLRFMDERQRPEPAAEYWDKYDESLKKRLTKADANGSSKVLRLQPFSKVPKWALEVAAALILVLAGVLIGRYYLSAPLQVVEKRETATSSTVQRVSMDPETKRFLERSEMLLVGIVNLEPEEDGSYPTDLAIQKKMSHDLIQEAPIIRAKLKGRNQRRLNELVSDLELILLQISNLESESDLPEIELVKSGVDHKGVLLKINLEQMRMSRAAKNEPEPKKVSGEKKL